MLAHLTRAAFSALLLASSALAQDVKYEKYALDNGLTVILHQDQRLPVATINLWYRVGAKEEPPRRSGFAHLFEHLMFMGTKRVAGNDFDIIMETGGGSNNASTSLDRTNYFSQGPSELLPTLLWLDADRLEDLGRMMTSEKVDKQRDVVRNELRQTIENTPYGKADHHIFSLMFPVGHPYHNSVAGTHEDLEAASVTNVKDFFANFYVPNNCSLVVAGDFDPAKIKPMIQAYYGSLPRGNAVVNRLPKDVPSPALTRVVRESMLDKVDAPRISFVYHSPAYYQPGDAEMDLAGSILASGKSSRLYKRLVLDEKLAADVGASQDSAVLGSLFKIDVYALPEADLSKVEKIMDEEIDRLLKDGITTSELEQRKSVIELGFLSRMDALSAIADKLNEYEYVWGEPNSFKRDLDRYRNATPDAVRDIARKTLTANARAIVRVLPEEPTRGETPRDKRPDLANASAFNVPKPEEFTLDCGVPVLLWKKSELPLVTMEMLIKAPGALGGAGAKGGNGVALDPIGRPGLAFVMSQMLDEGAGDLDALKYSDALQALGARLNASASREDVTVSFTALKRTLDKAAPLFADAILRPRMDPVDFERVVRLHKEQLEQDLQEPGTVANRVAARMLFGPDHPYGQPTVGTLESIAKVTLDEVKVAHTSIMNPASARLLVCGDLTVDEAKRALNAAFKNWKSNASSAATSAATPIAPTPQSSGNAMRVYLVDRPDAVQTVIRFAAPGPKLGDSVRPTFEALNTVLGGSFTSRLNQNIREQHGYAYGAGSRFNMFPSAGMFTASSSVKASVTGAALGEFLKEFDRLRAGDVSDDEVTKAFKTLRTDTIQQFSTMQGVVGTAAQMMSTGLPLETSAADMAAWSNLNAKTLNSIARSALPLEQGVLVLVGDRKLILEQIKDLKLSAPIELSPNGTPAPQASDRGSAG